MRKQRKHFDDESEVDMTPMLDIVFIMLIFFIVTTSFTKEDGIELNRPAANPPSNTEPKNNRPIVISISESSEITMDGRIVDVAAVRANVESGLAKNAKALVIVQAHPAAKSGVVVRAVDQAKQAGADKVTVAKPAS